MSAHLPLELWYAVADNLNFVQIKSFLGISRIHRSIAQKLLFSHLKVFFGAPETNESYTAVTDEVESVLYERAMNQAWEILSAIRLDPSFAQVVNKLTIHTFLRESEEFGIFYRGAICEALKALPHLVSFSWFGESENLPAEVLDSIVAYCPHLRELSIPIHKFPLSTDSLLELEHLRNLALRQPNPMRESKWWRDESENHGHTNNPETLLPQLEQVAKNNKIETLVVATQLLWKLSIRMFENLTELEITFGDNFHNLHLVFRHAERLRSLTFADIFDRHLFRVLAENSSALPLLTSFKATADWRTSFAHPTAHVVQLAEFLKTKTRLRRLDVHLMCPTIFPFLSILRKLVPSLEILGLFTGLNYLTKEDYWSLAQVLPPKITALRLSTRCEPTPETREAADALIQRFSHLSFLDLNNHDLPSQHSIDELTSKLQRVSVFGLNHTLYYVNRPTESNHHAVAAGDGASAASAARSNVEMVAWSWRRIQFRVVEDFGGPGCEDFEWLLRYHDVREWGW